MPLIRNLRHAWIASNLHAALAAYSMARKLGRLTLEQVGYEAALPGEPDQTIWGPDVAFVSVDHVPAALTAIEHGDYAPAPDEPMRTLKASDLLDGLDVAPGFMLLVADLFVFA